MSPTTPPPTRIGHTPPLRVVAARPSAAAAAASLPSLGELDPRRICIGQGLKPALELAQKFSKLDLPVLITGPSGTGKELFARIIWRSGQRGPNSFVAVNCGALPAELAESELFGHEKGSFTGAVGRHKGYFEQASGGTLFLDEIGEMPLAQQVKLLRVLEEHTCRRVGGEEKVTADVRIICATNKDLKQEVKAGRFREDLYYRVSAFEINLPPLRDRTEDILDLAQFFLAEACQRTERQLAGFEPEAERALLAHDWPGNVRELQNVISRVAVMAAGDKITAADIWPQAPAEAFLDDRLLTIVARQAVAGGLGFWQTLGRLEKPVLLAALEKSGGSRTAAAQLLGLQPRSFYRLLHRNGL